MNGMEFSFSKPLDTANRFSCLENLTTERESTQVPSDREYSAAVKSQGFPQTTSSRSIRQNKATALDKRNGDWDNSWAASSKITSEDDSLHCSDSKIASQTLCAQMPFINIRAVVAMPLTMVQPKDI